MECVRKLYVLHLLSNTYKKAYRRLNTVHVIPKKHWLLRIEGKTCKLSRILFWVVACKNYENSLQKYNNCMYYFFKSGLCKFFLIQIGRTRLSHVSILYNTRTWVHSVNILCVSPWEWNCGLKRVEQFNEVLLWSAAFVCSLDCIASSYWQSLAKKAKQN